MRLHIHTTDLGRARVEIEDTYQHVDHSGLAGSVPPQNGHDFVGFDLKRGPFKCVYVLTRRAEQVLAETLESVSDVYSAGA